MQEINRESDNDPGSDENELPELIDCAKYPYMKLFIEPGGEYPDQYHNKNHVTPTDNWFSSIEAMDQVRQSGNHVAVETEMV